MKRFTQQFHTEAQKQRLSAEEKFLLREKLVTFMEYHPLPAKAKASPVARIDLADPYVVISFPWKRLRMGVGMLALSVVIAVPAFAEQTLPGDILYPVKVRVNEEVRGSMARTLVDKAEWETKLLERRLSEARTLAKTGRLDAVESTVVAAVEKQKNEAKSSIENLRVTDSVEADMAEVTLASVVEVQTVALQTQLTASETETATTSAPVVALVLNLEQERARLLANDTNLAEIPVERFIAQVERQTTRAYERLASLYKIISLQETQDVTRRLKDIEGKVANAFAMTEETPDTAREQFRLILGDVQKLLAYMNDLDIRNSVAIDRVVPIVLTYEERVAQLAPNIDILVSDIKKVEQQVETIRDESAKEKVLFHLPTLQTFVMESAGLTPETIDAIAAQYEATKLLMDSIRVLVRVPVAPITEEVVPDQVGTSTDEILEISTTTATTS